AAWMSDDVGMTGYDMVARRFSVNSSGITALTGDVLVNTTVLGLQGYGSVAVDPTGGFLVAWESDGQDGSGYGVYAQRFAADGTRIGPETRLNTTTAVDQTFPRVAIDGRANFRAVWTTSGQDGSGLGVMAERIGG